MKSEKIYSRGTLIKIKSEEEIIKVCKAKSRDDLCLKGVHFPRIMFSFCNQYHIIRSSYEKTGRTTTRYSTDKSSQFVFIADWFDVISEDISKDGKEAVDFFKEKYKDLVIFDLLNLSDEEYLGIKRNFNKTDSSFLYRLYPRTSVPEMLYRITGNKDIENDFRNILLYIVDKNKLK